MVREGVRLIPGPGVVQTVWSHRHWHKISGLPQIEPVDPLKLAHGDFVYLFFVFSNKIIYIMRNCLDNG